MNSKFDQNTVLNLLKTLLTLEDENIRTYWVVAVVRRFFEAQWCRSDDIQSPHAKVIGSVSKQVSAILSSCRARFLSLCFILLPQSRIDSCILLQTKINPRWQPLSPGPLSTAIHQTVVCSSEFKPQIWTQSLPECSTIPDFPDFPDFDFFPWSNIKWPVGFEL